MRQDTCSDLNSTNQQLCAMAARLISTSRAWLNTNLTSVYSYPPRRLTSLLPSRGVRQTGPSAKLASMYYISRTLSWVKVTIWLPSPPMGLTIHIGAQVHGEPRGIC